MIWYKTFLFDFPKYYPLKTLFIDLKYDYSINYFFIKINLINSRLFILYLHGEISANIILYAIYRNDKNCEIETMEFVGLR